MNAAGIDVSKGKSTVSVFRPFNEVVAKPFEVRHTGSELKQLADYLKSLGGETRVVMEHTGRYYEPYAKWCKRHGYHARTGRAESIYDNARDLVSMLPKDAMTKLLVRQAADSLNAVSAAPAGLFRFYSFPASFGPSSCSALPSSTF